MHKQTVLTLFTGAALAAAAVCTTYAQEAPAPAGGPPAAAAPAGGRGGRGGRGGGGGRGGAQTPPGPPAPVPPEVAIPRPTADEVAKINADLQKFIETNTSPDKDLLKKYASLLTVQVPRENSAIRPTAGGRGNMNQLAQTDFDVMLLGDSIASLLTVDDDGGGNPGGNTAMKKYLGDVKYANFGVPGDSTQGVLGRLQNGQGQGHKPKAVLLLIGTNNNSNTAAEIAEGVGADVYELRKDFPDAKILVMGIFPRGETPADAGRIRVAEANKIISKLEDKQHVFYMDLTPKMLTPDGKLIGFRTTDHLHPVVEGFDIWISSAAPMLKSWVK